MSKKIVEQVLNVGSATAVGGGGSDTGVKVTRMPDGKRNIGQSGEDFPMMDDSEYTTHMDYKASGGKASNSALEWLAMLEQDIDPEEEAPPPPEETMPEEAPPEGAPEEAPPEGSPPMDPGAMQDPSMMGGMQDPMMGGMGGFTSTEIGRIYELKKIYSRLMTIEAFLGEETNPEMMNLRSSVSKSIDLFETLIANIQTFKEKLDEIIINFYKFIDQVLDEIRTYYKKKSNQDEEVK